MRFYQDKDFKEISHWCSLRDRPAPEEWALPDSGFIVDGVACGFLVMTNTKIGILDFYISNPHADKEARREALEEITNELIEAAKEVGIRSIVFSTQFESIRQLGHFFGFTSDGEYSYFTKEL
jgi:hypothetical protein